MSNFEVITYTLKINFYLRKYIINYYIQSICLDNRKMMVQKLIYNKLFIISYEQNSLSIPNVRISKVFGEI
jgi:hypothetical protein